MNVIKLYLILTREHSAHSKNPIDMSNPVLFTLFDEVVLERYYNAMQTRHTIVISKKQKNMSVAGKNNEK